MNPIYRTNSQLTTVPTVIVGLSSDQDHTSLKVRDLAFFPGGGGQPPEGPGCYVRVRGHNAPVRQLRKSGGDVWITLAERLPFHEELRSGETAEQLVEPQRRLQASAMHTVQHAFGGACRLVLPDYETRGMVIAPDLRTCTMHFTAKQAPSGKEVERIRQLVAAGIAEDLPVIARTFASVEAARDELGAVLRVDSTLPPYKGTRLRTILIGEKSDFLRDASMCGGTHLLSLGIIEETEIVEAGADPHTSTYSLTFGINCLAHNH